MSTPEPSSLDVPVSWRQAPALHRVEGHRGRRGAGLRPGIPFVAVHLACLAVIAVGVSPVALGVAAVSYLARMFGITAFYHRYFSHRSFRCSRGVQFGGAVLGAAAAQRGPLWWAAHHRQHHRSTDRPGDPHTPREGFWHAHLLWLFDPANQATRLDLVPDLARYRELRILDRYHHLVPVLTALATFGVGVGLATAWPSLHTSGWQVFVWGFVVATVALYHSTFAVNSVAHRFGRRRFATRDDSRNNALVALLTLGEGWHNNHHRFPRSARQGLGRFEADPTWLGLRLLARLGLVSDLQIVSPRALALARLPAGASGEPESSGLSHPNRRRRAAPDRTAPGATPPANGRRARTTHRLRAPGPRSDRARPPRRGGPAPLEPPAGRP
jgi:stearoyl-CoA desaturase (delta-9 desaturase)